MNFKLKGRAKYQNKRTKRWNIPPSIPCVPNFVECSRNVSKDYANFESIVDDVCDGFIVSIENSDSFMLFAISSEIIVDVVAVYSPVDDWSQMAEPGL